MQTTVRHEAELESDPLWHVQPVQFVVQECRQTTVICYDLIDNNNRRGLYRNSIQKRLSR